MCGRSLTFRARLSHIRASPSFRGRAHKARSEHNGKANHAAHRAAEPRVFLRMPIKESSDELNPPEAVSETQIAPRRRRTLADLVALTIATCGVGYAPIAPGTLGSILGILMYLAIGSLTM